MLLETCFLGEVVDAVETQLLTLTQRLTDEENLAGTTGTKSLPADPGSGWQQPRLSMFNVSG